MSTIQRRGPDKQRCEPTRTVQSPWISKRVPEAVAPGGSLGAPGGFPGGFPDGPWCKEGDWVVITKYAGSRLYIDGGELRIVNDDEVIAQVDDPLSILPSNIRLEKDKE